MLINLNSSEELAFFGVFGLVFSLPNFNQIFLQKVFPMFLENPSQFRSLFRVIYLILLFALTYESIEWAIQLEKNMNKTRFLNINYNTYLAKVIFFAMAGAVAAIFLNKLIF